jgi:hypothetical protein
MTHEFQARDTDPCVSYGPAGRNRPGEFTLAVSTVDGERVDIGLGEHAMYRLWMEVRGTPWPWPDHENRRDRLVREVLHLANGADEEMLREAIEVLGGRCE